MTRGVVVSVTVAWLLFSAVLWWTILSGAAVPVQP